MRPEKRHKEKFSVSQSPKFSFKRRISAWDTMTAVLTSLPWISNCKKLCEHSFQCLFTHSYDTAICILKHALSKKWPPFCNPINISLYKSRYINGWNSQWWTVDDFVNCAFSFQLMLKLTIYMSRQYLINIDLEL